MNSNQTPQITPDEILFELVDIGHLLFPNVPNDFQFDFIPTEDGLWPALNNLSGNPLKLEDRTIPVENAFASENELLDRVNAYLQALSGRIEEEVGKRIVNGALMIQPVDNDGAKEVWFVDRDKESEDQEENEGIVRLKRRFDKSELQSLFFTPEFFTLWNKVKDGVFDFEQRSGTWLTQFSTLSLDREQRLLVQDGTPVGHLRLGATYHRDSQTMMWGFAHENLPEIHRCPPPVDAMWQQPGLGLFQKPELIISEKMAIRLVQTRASLMKNIDAVIRLTHNGEHGLLDFMWLVEGISST